MSVNHLIPAITRALTAPGVDLGQISAKSVRKSMLAADASLDPTWVKDNKESIDALIADIFNTVTAAKNANPPQPQPQPQPAAKRKRSPSPKPLPSSQVPMSARDPKRAATGNGVAKKAKEGLSDAELARQLSAELNPTATRATRGSAASGSKPVKSGKAKKKKSKSSIEDSDDDGNDNDDDDDDAPKRKRTKATKEGGGARGGLGAEYMLSDTLADLTGTRSLSRPQVVKQLWVYIKAKSLQNPNNKREILCDDKVRNISSLFKLSVAQKSF